MRIQYHSLPSTPPTRPVIHTAPPSPENYQPNQLGSQQLPPGSVTKTVNRVWFSEMNNYSLIVVVILALVAVGTGVYVGGRALIRSLKKKNVRGQEAEREAGRCGGNVASTLRSSSQENVIADAETVGGHGGCERVEREEAPVVKKVRFSEEVFEIGDDYRYGYGEARVLERRYKRESELGTRWVERTLADEDRAGVV